MRERGTGEARPLRREAPTATGGGGSRSAGACARPREAEPRRGRGSAAAAGGTGGAGRAAGGRVGRRQGREVLARLLAPRSAGSAALPGRQSRRRSIMGRRR